MNETAAQLQSRTGARIGAAIVDILLMFALMILFGLVAGDVGETETETGSQWGVTLRDEAFVAYLVLVFAYYTLMEGLTGATIGKKLAGLRVVADTGEPIGWRPAVLRNLVRFIDFLPVFYFVGIIAIAVSSRRQRLGDLVARTLVV